MLGFIVTVHEFGHYIAARLCGIGVLEFSVGFGPKLLGFRRKEIDYSLRLIPLGGYCRLLGEDDGDPDDPRSMNKQPVWKRFLTFAAGPAMNFVLAFIFCIILLSNYLVAEYLPRISYIYENTPAQSCGFETGDVIRSMNGTEISYDQSGVELAQAIILEAEGEAIDFIVERGGQNHALSVAPQAVETDSGTTAYQIGISFGARTFSFGEAVGGSVSYMVEITGSMLQSLKDLVFGRVGTDGMMGPVGIISFVSDLVYNEQMFAVVQLIFILSLNIGIMNLLPLPALDGGRLIFLLVEAVRRKPIPPEKEGTVHAMGMLLLLALIVFITYKDILRLFAGA